jgi:WD40 repeat protein
VFDAATGAELARLDHDGPVSAVVFSPDGRRVATGSWDRSARVFDAATGAELARLDHGGPVTAVAFSPDGMRVATGSWDRVGGGDRSARVFDTANGAELARLDHGGPVSAVAFSPDASRVATGSEDESARVFEATPDLLVQRAIDVLARPLNPTELRRYLLPPNCLHVERWNLRRDHARPTAAEPVSTTTAR